MTLNPSPARDRCDAARPTPPNPMLACETLDDRALLSLMLGRSADDPDRLACNLLTHFGSLGAVLAADLSELIRTVHAGPAVFGELKILRELAVRLARIEAGRRPAIASWTALLAYVRTAMAHLPREQLGLFIVDRVFDRAELRLGDRRPQIVRIRRLHRPAPHEGLVLSSRS
jgi:DNA repair protein RadC